MSLAMPAVDASNPGAAEPAAPLNSARPPSGPDVTVGPTGRLRDHRVSDTERNFSIAMHLSPFAWFIGVGPLALVIPVILWLVRKDDSVFNDDHGREVVNFGISFFLLHLLLAMTVIGLAAWPVLWVVGVVNMIRGAVAASGSEYFRYPMTIRILS